MGLAALLYAGGQRACLRLRFQSVRMVVQRSCCGLNWVTNVVSQPIPDWGSWFTVAVSVKVDLISLPSEFVLVLHIATDEYWAGQELWVYRFAGPMCLCYWYNHCCLEHVPQDVRNHVMYFLDSDRKLDSDETKRGFLLLTPTGGRMVGFLVEVAVRPTNFSPQGSGLLNWSGLPMGGIYG